MPRQKYTHTIQELKKKKGRYYGVIRIGVFLFCTTTIAFIGSFFIEDQFSSDVGPLIFLRFFLIAWYLIVCSLFLVLPWMRIKRLNQVIEGKDEEIYTLQELQQKKKNSYKLLCAGLLFLIPTLFLFIGSFVIEEFLYTFIGDLIIPGRMILAGWLFIASLFVLIPSIRIPMLKHMIKGKDMV